MILLIFCSLIYTIIDGINGIFIVCMYESLCTTLNS